MIGIVVSRADEASAHIGEHLLDAADWRREQDPGRLDGDGGGTYYRTDGFELREFDGLHINLEGVAGAFQEPDCVVFVSRHAGDTGPLLTAHFTGNFGPAEFGGRAGELARACPNAHREVLAALRRHVPAGYDVGMECTHHGPSDLDVPSMFVELGSAEAEWRDAEAARAVARAVLDLRDVVPGRERTVVGFGGGHYVPRFERIVRETDWAVGHVAADWCLEAMGVPDPAVLGQAFEASGATRAVIDGDRPELVRAVERLGYRVVSETWVRETSGVSLDLIDLAESSLSAVDDGLRFGEAAEGGPVDGFEVYDPDPALLTEVHGIDPDRTREAIARRSVAYETAEGGRRVTGRIALTDRVAHRALVDDLCAVLGQKYDVIERSGTEVIARETAFDPALARERGIAEGPAFGRLAAGEPVESPGGTVYPDEVYIERTRRFRL